MLGSFRAGTVSWQHPLGVGYLFPVDACIEKRYFFVAGGEYRVLFYIFDDLVQTL